MQEVSNDLLIHCLKDCVSLLKQANEVLPKEKLNDPDLVNKIFCAQIHAEKLLKDIG